MDTIPLFAPSLDELVLADLENRLRLGANLTRGVRSLCKTGLIALYRPNANDHDDDDPTEGHTLATFEPASTRDQPAGIFITTVPTRIPICRMEFKFNLDRKFGFALQIIDCSEYRNLGKVVSTVFYKIKEHQLFIDPNAGITTDPNIYHTFFSNQVEDVRCMATVLSLVGVLKKFVVSVDQSQLGHAVRDIKSFRAYNGRARDQQAVPQARPNI